MKGGILSYFLFGTIHLAFLIGIVFPKWGWFSLLGLIPLLGYLAFKPSRVEYDFKDHLSSIIIFAIGFFLTKIISVFGGLPVVYASAITGLAFAFVKLKFAPSLPAIIYAGSFAGMVSGDRVGEDWMYISICLLGGTLMHLLKDNFNGVGGKLGSIGFGALLIPLIFIEGYYLPVHRLELVGYNLILVAFLILLSIVVAGVVYLIHNKTKINAIASSSLVTILMLFVLGGYAIDFHLGPLIFGASFVGMSSKKVLRIPYLLLSAILFGLMYYSMFTFLQGFGGTLGTMACLSCLVGVLFQRILSKT